jgi:hypothetical protein
MFPVSTDSTNVWAGTVMSRAALVKLAVVLWSFSWTYLVGHFGIFAFDQSIMFDGGWRILSGQVPFKDFIMAFGPLSFTVQALFFKLFGVNWTSMVLSAAFLGAGAALSVMRIMSLLFGKKRIWLIGLSGFLVGTSFQAMFGTLFMEQVGFFACLLGIQAICESVHSHTRHRFFYFALGGILSVLAFLSKQNVGVLTLVLLGVLVTLVALPEPLEVLKSLSSFLIGIAVAAGLFALWLVIFSDPHLFIRHALEVPSQVGRGRVHLKTILFLPSLLGAAGTTQWCYGVSLGAAFQSIVLVFHNRDFRRVLLATPAYRLAVGLTVGIPFFQRLFQITTLNQAENIIFLSGFSLSLGVCLFYVLSAATECHRQWIPVLACFISAFLLIEMMYVSWNRTVHDVFPLGAADLSKRLHVPQLASVRWISPTITAREGSPELDPQDIDAVYSYLASRKQDFFVLGDSTYLYGIIGVVPPQPLLYLQKGHFFLESDVPHIDDWVLTSLRNRDIRLIVRERHNFFGDFPLPNSLKWISDNFHSGPTFGNFEILLR